MKAQQQGFTLVEVVIALVLMAIILTTLGGLTFVTARQAVVADNTMEREAASLEMVNRYAAMPFNQLTVGTACDSAGSTISNGRKAPSWLPTFWPLSKTSQK